MGEAQQGLSFQHGHQVEAVTCVSNIQVASWRVLWLPCLIKWPSRLSQSLGKHLELTMPLHNTNMSLHDALGTDWFHLHTAFLQSIPPLDFPWKFFCVLIHSLFYIFLFCYPESFLCLHRQSLAFYLSLWHSYLPWQHIWDSHDLDYGLGVLTRIMFMQI